MLTAFATDDAPAASGGASGGHASRWVLRSAAAAACQQANRARDFSRKISCIPRSRSLSRCARHKPALSTAACEHWRGRPLQAVYSGCIILPDEPAPPGRPARFPRAVAA